MLKQPKVGIVILNWNNYEQSRECIESLNILSYSNYQIYLVDNNSSDNSFNNLKDKFPEVIFIKNYDNLGYAGGVNSGIKKALEDHCQYCWLVNNDAKIINSEALTALINLCESDNKIGAAGSLIKYPKGKIQFSGGKVKLPLVKGVHFEEDLKDNFESEYITGCSMLVPKVIIDRLGLINEDYFLYYEDADYCKRIKKAGYKCVVTPNSILEHELGGTSKKNPSLNYVYYNLRNRFLYAFRWLSTFEFLIFFITTLGETIIRAVRYMILGRKDSLRLLLQAFMDGIMRRPGKYKFNQQGSWY